MKEKRQGRKVGIKEVKGDNPRKDESLGRKEVKKDESLGMKVG